ncbi:MAG: DUF6339 family protein [Myxococcales bacterium]
MSELLRSLRPTARRLVTPELASGKLGRYVEAECAAFVAPLEREVPLVPIDAVVDRVLSNYAPHDPAADSELAIAVHDSLRLTRREAADPGVFRYLAVIRHPELVRHRWEYRSFAGMQGRFWRAGTRHDSNAFSRWWWIAELTRDGDDYTLTRQVLDRGSLAVPLFSRELGHYRPAVAAVVHVLRDVPASLIEATLKNLGKLLGVRVLEAMGERELRALTGEALELAARRQD